MTTITKQLLILLTFFVCLSAFAQNYEFAALRGYPQMNTAGWTLAGMAYTGSTNAGDGTPSELILTNAVNTTSGAAFFNTPVDISRCQIWTAEFDYRIFDGTGADGIGFFFLSNPPRDYVRGQGIGIPTGNSGLVVALDQYQNGNCYGGQVPKVEIRYVTPTSNYAECPSGPPQPTIGGVSLVRQPNYNTLKVTYDNGNISVYINNQLMLTGFYQINFTGYFGVSASTGGQTDVHSIKNFSLKTFRPILSAPNAGPNITLCPGGTAQIGTTPPPNDPYTYKWYPTTGIDNPNIANPNITLTNNSGVPQVLTYYLTKDTTGTVPRCAYSAELKVTVLGKAAVAGADLILCGNEARNLNVNARPGYSYRWFPATGLSNPFSASPIVQIPNSGTQPLQFQYILTATNTTLGCVDQDTLNITVMPEASKAGPDLNLCPGEIGTIGTNNPLPNFLYNWSPTTGLSNPFSNRTTVSIPNTGQTSQRIRYILTAFNTVGSCSTNDTVFVTVYPKPIINIGARTQTICHNEVVNLGAAPQIGQRYSWSPGSLLSDSTRSNPTFKGINTGTQPVRLVFRLTVTNTFTNCNLIDSTVVIVNPKPQVITGLADTLCYNASKQLGGPALPGYTYSWAPSVGISNPAVANPVFRIENTSSQAITYTYYLTVSSLGCSNRDSVKITVRPKPASPLINRQFSICDRGILLLNNTALPNQRYRWQPSPGLTNTNNLVASYQPSIGNLSEVQEWLYLSITDTLTGCTINDSVSVTVNANPVLNLSDITLCAGQQTNLGSPGLQGWFYTWSPISHLSNPNDAQPIFSWTTKRNTDTTLIYTVQAIQNGSCIIRDTISVLVKGLPLANAGIDRLELCQGDSTTIGTPSITGYTYRWAPTTGLDNPNSPQPRVSLSSGLPNIINYVVTATYNGCSNTDTVRVLVKPKPSSLLPNLIAVCNNQPVRIQNPPLTGYVYTWSTSAGLNDSTLADPTVQINSGKATDTTYYYYLKVSNPVNGCETLDTIGILVQPNPIANAGADKAVCPDQPVQLGTDSLANLTYSWRPIAGLSNPDAAKPYLIFGQRFTRDSTFKYVLEVTNSLTGCKSKDTVSVTLFAPPTVRLTDTLGGCLGSTLRLGPPSTVAGWQYRWTPSTGLNNPNVANPTLSVGNVPVCYKLTITNQNGCAVQDSQVVKPYSTPAKPGFGGRTSYCPGVNGIVYHITSPVQGLRYQWQVIGGSITSTSANTDTITVAWGAANPNAAVSVRAVSANGCQGPDSTLRITIKRVIDVQAPTSSQPGDSICFRQGAPIIYTAAPLLPYSQYRWYTSLNGIILSGQGTNQIVVQWNYEEMGKVWLEEVSQTPTDTCLGVSDTIKQYMVPFPELANLWVPPYTCQNLRLPTRFETQYVPNAYYIWNTPGATILGNFGPVLNVTYSQPGRYPVSVQVMGRNGCVGNSFTDTILVEPQPIIRWVDTNTTICTNNYNGYRYSVQGPAGMLYNWTIRGGTIVAGSADSAEVTVNWNPGAGIYQLRAQGTGTNGCTSLSVVKTLGLETINNTLWTASVLQTPDGNQPIELSYQAGNAPKGLFLQRRTLISADTSFVTVATLATGQTTYTDVVPTMPVAWEYRLAAANSCGQFIYTPLHRTIRLGADVSERVKDQIILKWNAYLGFNVGGYAIYRSVDGGSEELMETVPANNLENYTIERIWGSDGFNQCYRVAATGSIGRTETAFSNKACVNLANSPFIGNVVTPNQDGKNDVFELDYLSLYPNHLVEVYDRYGQRLQSFKPYQNNWPGSEVKSGTYFMLVDLGNGSAPRKFWVQVLR